eukprot:52676_1
MVTHDAISGSWIRWVFLVVICSNGMQYGVTRYILVPIQDQLMDWYDINAVEYNLLMTLYSFPNILCSIMCGILIDKFGVRKILSLSWFVILIGLIIIFISCISKDYIQLCIGRTIAGIGNEGLSISLKLYAIQFFNKREYGIVFGVYLAFISLGTGINTIMSYQIYLWFGIVYSIAIALIIAPFLAIPLFTLMYLETYKWKTNHCNKNKMETESTKLIETPTDSNKNTKKFKLKHIKTLSIYYWILLTGFVIWCGAAQASLNIAVSFLRHMFDVSYSFATTMSLFTNSITVISYLLSGFLSSKLGKLTDMLLFANIVGFVGHYIYGWINNHIFWAFFGGALRSMSLGFTYPVVWAGVSLLVDTNVRGTAYGFATSIRFGVIAVSYVMVGILTNDSQDGKSKYIKVQFYIVMLVIVSSIFYIILFILDIKYNNSVLRILHSNENEKSEGTEKEKDVDISMQKMSV